MSESLPFAPKPWRRAAAQIVLALSAVVSGAIYVLAPHYRQLLGYGVYAIPSHLLISVLPNEPMLFYVAKLYPPKLVATAGMLGSTVSGVLDYWLIGWFVNRGLVRSRLEDWRPYQIAKAIFGKAPFLLILGSAFAPLPFYPVKILSIACDYSLPLFLVAAALGRWPRLYLLAFGGQKVQAPNSWLVYAGVALVVGALVQLWRTRRKSRSQASGRL